MTASIVVIDSSAIRQIQYRTVNPSCFAMIAQGNLRAAKVVQKEWDNLSVKDRDLLKYLAYDTNTSDKFDKKLCSSSRHDFQILAVDVFRCVS